MSIFNLGFEKTTALSNIGVSKVLGTNNENIAKGAFTYDVRF